MRLRAVADCFDEIEATRARSRIVVLIAALLSRAGQDERAPLVYLLQSELGPPYAGIVLGVGEKLLAHAIAECAGVSGAEVARRYARTGDLGSVTAELLPASRRRRVSVRDVYDALLAIARVTGGGSLATRRRMMSDLLARLDGGEGRLVVRIAQGRLRLGVGDQTIVEATAVAALGGRDGKPLVEHAYAVRSDLGAIVRVAFAGGRRALERIAPEVGVPVRPALAQRLPSAAAIVHRLGEVQAEPKYDGFRLQLHRNGDEVHAFSRNLEDVTAMFPELTAALRRQLTVRRAIIEGEAVGFDPRTGAFLPFQETMTRKRKGGIAAAAARSPLRLFAFDVLYAGRASCLDEPQRARTARLREIVRVDANGPICVTDARVVHTSAELQRYFDAMLRRGLEGVVAKRSDAPYRAGARGYDWVKLKRAYESRLRDTVDVVLVGYQRGRGKRAALGIGSLLGAVYDPEHDRFRTVAKIGSGMSDEEWKALRRELDTRAVHERPARVDSRLTPDVWVEPTLVVEVLADEITRSPFHTCGRRGDAVGYALRFPRLVDGVRADKSATDATTEREVIDLFRMQRARGRGRQGAVPARRKAARTSARR